MKWGRVVRPAGAVAAMVLALAGCSKDANPTLPPAAAPPDAAIGDRGVQLLPDAAQSEARLTYRDASDDTADVATGSDSTGDRVAGIDLAPPPTVTVTILPFASAALDGGASTIPAPAIDGVDGGAPVAVISAASRFAPVVTVEVASHGGDPTAEVLTSVFATLVAPKSISPVASVKLNQTQYNVLPESESKRYLFSDTPLDLSKVPSGIYDLHIDATTAGGTTGRAMVSVYVDGGPSIKFLQPADGAYVKGSVVVTAIIDDSQAGVGSVSFSVGQTELPAGALSRSGVQYTATIDFGSFDPPLDGAQVLTVTAVNGNGIPSLATLKFTVDNTGPAITATKPASGELIGKLVTIEAKVDDPAGVMSNSVIAVVAHGDVHFEVKLAKAADGMYRQIFDTTMLEPWAISPSISFRAQDVLGNQSSVGYLVSLDNTPPILDLDPPATFRLYKSDGTCSWPFDPVGPDAIDDGSIVTQLFDIRARIEDDGNKPQSGTADFVTIAGIDPSTVKVLILDDTSLPLVVDTSDPPDGLCDDINPELAPSVSPKSSKDAQLLDMAPLPAGAGSGDFSHEPGSLCSGSDPSPKPDVFCATTYNPLKGRYMTYSLGYGAGNWPAIWSVGPVIGDKLQCAGRQFDASNNLKDGWACVAVEAADKLGNKQVSRPVRICVAAEKDSTACSATAMGGVSLASVALPGSSAGKITFTTSAPLVNAAGAVIKDGEPVIFTGVGPLALGGLNGTRTVKSTGDGTGKSFTISDLAVSPALLYPVPDDPDAGVPVGGGSVGLLFTDGAPVHVFTSPDSALPIDFKGKVVLSNSGLAQPTWAVTNVDPSGFDLVGSVVKLTGGAVAFSRLPDCTGTVIKQTSGEPKVDGTKPCKPYASFPPREALRL